MVSVHDVCTLYHYHIAMLRHHIHSCTSQALLFSLQQKALSFFHLHLRQRQNLARCKVYGKVRRVTRAAEEHCVNRVRLVHSVARMQHTKEACENARVPVEARIIERYIIDAER